MTPPAKGQLWRDIGAAHRVVRMLAVHEDERFAMAQVLRRRGRKLTPTGSLTRISFDTLRKRYRLGASS